MLLVCDKFQAYHRDVLENMPPPPVIVSRFIRPVSYTTNKSSSLLKKTLRRGRGDRRSGSRRHRKVVDNFLMNQVLV